MVRFPRIRLVPTVLFVGIFVLFSLLFLTSQQTKLTCLNQVKIIPGIGSISYSCTGDSSVHFILQLNKEWTTENTSFTADWNTREGDKLPQYITVHNNVTGQDVRLDVTLYQNGLLDVSAIPISPF